MVLFLFLNSTLIPWFQYFNFNFLRKNTFSIISSKMLFWKQYFKFLYKYLISYDTLKSKGKFRGLKSKKHGYNL